MGIDSTGAADPVDDPVNTADPVFDLETLAALLAESLAGASTD